MRDPDKARARSRRYEAAHRDERRQKNRDYVKANAVRLAAYNKAYRKAHPEKVRAYLDRDNRKRRGLGLHKTEARKRWLKEHAEELRAYKRAYSVKWRAEHPDLARAAWRREYVKNRQKYIQRSCLATAARRARCGRTLTLAEWREIVAAWDELCAYCGRPGRTIDHMVPLARGGTHDKNNVVPACRECNNRKQTLLPLNFIWRRCAA